MARWALALSILGCIPFGFVVGAGLAVAVLVRSSEGRNYGTGKAIAALVLGGVWLLVIAALTVTGFVQAIKDGVDAERDEGGRVTERSEIDLRNLRVGDCFDDPNLKDVTTDDATESSSAEVVPCREEHQFEAYHAFELTSDDYPGEERVLRHCGPAMLRRLRALCQQAAQPLDPRLLPLQPAAARAGASWVTEQCSAWSPDPEGPVTGTLRGADR